MMTPDEKKAFELICEAMPCKDELGLSDPTPRACDLDNVSLNDIINLMIKFRDQSILSVSEIDNYAYNAMVWQQHQKDLDAHTYREQIKAAMMHATKRS